MTESPSIPFYETPKEDTATRKSRFFEYVQQHKLEDTSKIRVVANRYVSITVGAYISQLNEQLEAEWLGV